MFGISTSWNSGRHTSAYPMLKEIKELGIDCVELNFTLSKKMVSEVAELAVGDQINVASLHNFCPVPDSIRIEKASPDYYSLASTDEKERKMALEATRRTIDTACGLKAQAVVVHSGRVNIKDRTRKLVMVIEKGGDAAPLIQEMQKEREKEMQKGHLDCLLKSIGQLSEYSKSCGIKIGMENRFYFRELPSVGEFEIIFEHFGKDSNIFYWHDTGHAQVFENLGLASHVEYLERFSARLIGVHLHDVRGLINDHNAPLCGNFDFSKLKPYIHENILKILEPHAPASATEIKNALEYLKGLYE